MHQHPHQSARDGLFPRPLKRYQLLPPLRRVRIAVGINFPFPVFDFFKQTSLVWKLPEHLVQDILELILFLTIHHPSTLGTCHLYPLMTMVRLHRLCLRLGRGGPYIMYIIYVRVIKLSVGGLCRAESCLLYVWIGMILLQAGASVSGT